MQQSTTLIIPIEIARRHESKAIHVVVQETPEGILIRRLEIKDNSLQPDKVSGHSLVAATVDSIPPGVDDALYHLACVFKPPLTDSFSYQD